MSEPTIVSSVCSPWATAGDLPTGVTAELGGLLDADVTAMLYVASDLLYALSGRRWKGGGCTRTVTISTDCRGTGTAGSRLQASGGAARAWASRLQLPGDAPVTAITALLDGAGAAIAPERYRLYNGREVEALDPAAGRPVAWPWPEVTITYEYGARPPIGGRLAAVHLASEFLLARVNSSTCRLPERVKEITRQNISMTLLDPMDFLDKGRTGLLEVDAWLASVNPARARARPIVWSPDTDTTVRSHPHGG